MKKIVKQLGYYGVKTILRTEEKPCARVNRNSELTSSSFF